MKSAHTQFPTTKRFTPALPGKQIHAGHRTLQRRFYGTLLMGMLCLLSTFEVRANCIIPPGDISGISPACTGTALIAAGTTVTVNADFTLPAGITKLVIAGILAFPNNNVELALPADIEIQIIAPGGLSTGPPCNAIKLITVGGAVLASCNGGGAPFSFADLNAAGGSNPPEDFCDLEQSARVFVNTTSQPIPDESTITSQITVSGAGPFITDVNMITFITHTFNSNLGITLTSPSGTVAVISTNNGSDNDNVFNGTLWDDSAPIPVTDNVYVNNVTAPFLAPEGAFGAFIGEDPNGVWTLTITDDLATNVGELSAWWLEISTVLSAPTTTSTTYNYAGAPQPIPDASTITSQITVSGVGVFITDVNMITFITHTFNGDLDITLTSPSGTVVVITADNGGDNDNVFNGTLWDDSAPIPVTDNVYANNVTAPFLAPEGAFGAFIGEDPNGVWTLTITNDAPTDAGELSAWSLEIATCSDCDLVISDVTPTPEGCPGADDGSITVTATTSNSPITYSIAGPVNQSNNTGVFTGLAPGNYTITATDAADCGETSSTTVNAGTDNIPPTITCPSTQTLVLGDDCRAPLPDYRGMASASDNCGTPGVTQSPSPGTQVSGAGNMTVTLTATDASGNSTQCSFTVTKIDNTPPNISCPATQTLVLGADCRAALPDYRSMAAASDSCGVQGMTQTPMPGTIVMGADSLTVILTATDVNGNSTSCSFRVNKVDNTPPTIICPATQTLALGANCSATLPNYTGLAAASDSCGVQSVMQFPAAGTTVSDTGNMTVTLIATDVNGNSAQCTFTVNKVDNTPPSITCPATQTLLLNSDCRATLPNYTGLATVSDGCGVQSVTQMPAAGTLVSGAGNMVVRLFATDVNNNIDSCSFTVTKVDNTPPNITCPATQTLALGANCSATLPDYTGLAAASDSCGVQSVMQFPAAGTTVSDTGNMTVMLTATDVNGNTAQCMFTVNKVDNTAPSITCPATQTLALGANCSATLPNYAGLAAVNDGCGVQSVTQSPAAGTLVSGTGNMVVKLFATDANNNVDSCSFTVIKVDNTPPTIQCFNQTVTFNGENTIPLNAGSLVDTTDNCGVATIMLSPNGVSCEQVGQIVPVTVTVTDVNGNPATCTSNITVGGLPCGWSQNPNGVNCPNGSNIAFNSGTGVWTATSTNCFYGPAFTADQLAFAQRTLCGDGSITAEVTGISGTALGWAGVVMRESNAAGAKKAQLMTNLSSLSRREFRITTNGQAFPQQFPSQDRYWLRLVRAGNQFSMYVSPNGLAWYFAGAQNIPMNSCIQVGLVATNYQPNSTVTATFANVAFTGSNVPPLVGAGGREHGAESIESPHSFEVYPNPTSGELNVNLAQYAGRAVRLEVYSLTGQLLRFTEIDEVQTTVERLDLSGFAGGLYLVKVKSDGLPDVAKRVAVTR
jgi:subtilisin-like proprotein convertase family protein/regulation of enolase protein 1 (concanavalin A-like superfamily)/uncharacterized protein YbbK (DUF523 family)